MTKSEIVLKMLNSIEQGKFDQAELLVTDDFRFSGPVPEPIGKREWLALHQNVKAGIPDFKFNITELNESGNVVNGTAQVSGTHTKEMPSLFPGMDAIPATNKTVTNPKENVTWTFKGDKIASMAVEKLPNGGVKGILKQLGVTIKEKI